MNNKGFIATSLVYAFFLVFVAVVATVLATYTHNRILINNVNSGVEDDLNQSIEDKYIVLENMLKNNNLEEDGKWNLVNASNINPSFSAYLGFRSIAINKGNSVISQAVHNLKKNHYYYLRFYLFRNGAITGTSAITLQNLYNLNIIASYSLSLVSNEQFINWNLISNIVQVSADGDYNFQITGTNINGTFNNLNIDALMLVDVTDIINAGNSVPNTKNYMDTFDYFEGEKSIIKP